MYPPFTLWTYWVVKKFPTKEDYEFKNVEFMQYTGLKDKRGKEIYEGDIIRLKKGNFPVFFILGMFMTGDDGKTIDNISLALLNHLNNEIDVIGNVYENPELLKGGD